MAEGEVFDFNQLKVPNVSPKVIRYGVIGVLVLILFFSSFFTIRPDEVGVILRLGKYSHTAEPGLHFKLPLGIDQLTKVPVQRQLK
ncbi:MAG: FtsH protease activity modulator HflK, partial [Calditrichales bacterium]